jgi:hypothetical protein
MCTLDHVHEHISASRCSGTEKMITISMVLGLTNSDHVLHFRNAHVLHVCIYSKHTVTEFAGVVRAVYREAERGAQRAACTVPAPQAAVTAAQHPGATWPAPTWSVIHDSTAQMAAVVQGGGLAWVTT